MNNKDAIAIITYSRASYFELVVSSILTQRIGGASIFDLYDVYVFHDGLADDVDSETRQAHGAIEKIVLSVGEGVKYIRQNQNLGIALHFDYIERFLFRERGHEYAFFFEDDLMLAPGHLQVLSLLRQKFGSDDRVGMVAANSTGAFEPISVQKENVGRYLPMDHNWAFGLSRRFWIRRQPFVDLYLKFVNGIKYRNRPTKDILSWLESCGLHGRASSQDYIKQCATVLAGGVRISTFPNFGLYIGREGVHCTPELFSKMGFSESQVYPENLSEVSDLSTDAYNKMLNFQLKIHVKDVASFDPERWRARIEAGSLDPSVVKYSAADPGFLDFRRSEGS